MLKVFISDKNARLPTKGTIEAAGVDLYSTIKISLTPGSINIIPLGLYFEIERGFFGLIKSRSGMAGEFGIIVLGGIVDSDYRGEIKVILQNCSRSTKVIEIGDRIAQLVLLYQPEIKISQVNFIDLTKTARGNGGFGSTCAPPLL